MAKANSQNQFNIDIAKRIDAVCQHQRRIEKLQEWLDEYREEVTESDTLSRWCEHSVQGAVIPIETVDISLKFTDKKYAEFMQRLKDFVADYLTHGTA